MGLPVKLYAISTCPHCSCTKKLLNECGVRYHCAEVDQLPKDEVAAMLEEVKRLNSRCSFPTIVIGDKVIVGHREKEIKEALGL